MSAIRPIEVTTLNSGLTVATERIDAVRSVAFGLWFRVGAADESDRLLGISHFIEHLVFKGTKRMSARRVAERFDSLGAEVNAFTGKEYTCFYSRLISDHVREGFGLYRDLLQRPAFRPKDIESERRVVLEEIAMYEDSPDEQIHDIFVRTIFAGHELANIILGRSETIRALTRDDIVAYHAAHYRPERLVLTAAGRVTHEDMLSLAERWQRLGVPAPALDEAPPPRRAGRARPPRRARGAVEIVPKDTQQAHLCLGFPVFGAGHPDRFALGLLDTILGGSMSSRLFMEVRERRGLAYSVYSYHSYFTGVGFLAAYAGTNPGNAGSVISLMLREFRRLAEERVPATELNRSREHLKGHLALANENTSARMMRLGRSLLAGDEILTLDEAIERIDAVTADDIQRVAATYLTVSPTLAVIGPIAERDVERALRA